MPMSISNSLSIWNADDDGDDDDKEVAPFFGLSFRLFERLVCGTLLLKLDVDLFADTGGDLVDDAALGGSWAAIPTPLLLTTLEGSMSLLLM